MKNLLIFALLLVSISKVFNPASTAAAQWGTGGGAGALDANEIPLSSKKMFSGMRDILDDIHGFDDGDRPATEAGKPRKSSGNDSPMEESEDGTKTFKRKGRKDGGPDPREDEYIDSWMPSARKGFEVPQRYRQSLNVRPSQSADSEEEDIEDVLNERARKEMPRRSPGVETRRIDKCLRQVARFCSFNMMDNNFAEFTKCCYDVRHHVKQSCFEWCDNHGRCQADMVKHCHGKTPMDTTECMLAKKEVLTSDCTDSPYFKSLEDGVEEMRKDRKNAADSRKAAASPEADDGPRFANQKKFSDDDMPEDDDVTDESTETLKTTFTDEL